MYTMQTLREAVRILASSPFWAGYSVEVKRMMVRELSAILFIGSQATN